MQIDKLFQHNFANDNLRSESYDAARGVLNGIMITTNGFGPADKLSVKVRDLNRTHVLATRLSMNYVSVISQHTNPTSTKTAQAVRNIMNGVNDNAGTEVFSRADFERFAPDVNVYYLPLGHIQLGETEIEIQFEPDNSEGRESVSGSEEVEYNFYSVFLRDESETYIQYDETGDMDFNSNAISEIYFYNAENLWDEEEGFSDIHFQIDAEDFTFLSDLEGLLSGSYAFGEIDSIPEILSARIFKTSDEVPSDYRVKVTGEDVTSDATLLFTKEIVPESVTRKNVERLDKLASRVEKLERTNADYAKRLRHAEKIMKSEDIKAAKEVAEENAKEDSEDSGDGG